MYLYGNLGLLLIFLCNLWAQLMATLYCFAASCLFGVVFLHKLIKRSKAGDCVQSQFTNLSRFKEPRTDSPVMRAPILKARSVSYLFPSSWALRCVLWEIFLKVFGSGQSDVRSGASMPPCCVVKAIVLYTLIHRIIPNTAHAQIVDYLRVGRAMFCHAIFITRIP